MTIKPKTIRPYDLYDVNELILRDQLAADRTILANERTFLAYVRTSLTALVVGISLFKFFDNIMTDIIGSISIVVGIILAAIGAIRYIEIRGFVRQLKEKRNPNLKPLSSVSKR